MWKTLNGTLVDRLSGNELFLELQMTRIRFLCHFYPFGLCFVSFDAVKGFEMNFPFFPRGGFSNLIRKVQKWSDQLKLKVLVFFIQIFVTYFNYKYKYFFLNRLHTYCKMSRLKLSSYSSNFTDLFFKRRKVRLSLKMTRIADCEFDSHFTFL